MCVREMLTAAAIFYTVIAIFLNVGLVRDIGVNTVQIVQNEKSTLKSTNKSSMEKMEIPVFPAIINDSNINQIGLMNQNKPGLNNTGSQKPNKRIIRSFILINNKIIGKMHSLYTGNETTTRNIPEMNNAQLQTSTEPNDSTKQHSIEDGIKQTVQNIENTSDVNFNMENNYTNMYTTENVTTIIQPKENETEIFVANKTDEKKINKEVVSENAPNINYLLEILLKVILQQNSIKNSVVNNSLEISEKVLWSDDMKSLLKVPHISNEELLTQLSHDLLASSDPKRQNNRHLNVAEIPLSQKPVLPTKERLSDLKELVAVSKHLNSERQPEIGKSKSFERKSNPIIKPLNLEKGEHNMNDRDYEDIAIIKLKKSLVGKNYRINMHYLQESDRNRENVSAKSNQEWNETKNIPTERINEENREILQQFSGANLEDLIDKVKTIVLYNTMHPSTTIKVPTTGEEIFFPEDKKDGSNIVIMLPPESIRKIFNVFKESTDTTEQELNNKRNDKNENVIPQYRNFKDIDRQNRNKPTKLPIPIQTNSIVIPPLQIPINGGIEQYRDPGFVVPNVLQINEPYMPTNTIRRSNSFQKYPIHNRSYDKDTDYRNSKHFEQPPIINERWSKDIHHNDYNTNRKENSHERYSPDNPYSDHKHYFQRYNSRERNYEHVQRPNSREGNYEHVQRHNSREGNYEHVQRHNSREGNYEHVQRHNPREGNYEHVRRHNDRNILPDHNESNREKSFKQNDVDQSTELGDNDDNSSPYDEHFQNFLKTQEKVNDILERLLARAKSKTIVESI